MKKVISDNILQEKMLTAIDLLCKTVKITLGPKGHNVIINHSSFTPFITNDGVTIASNIASEDAVINTILELAKEASIKTNEVVGDGTTTTLVLLESIFTLGLKKVKSGYNPIILKKELDTITKKLITDITNKSRKPTNEDILNLAKVASQDKNIGQILTDSTLKVGIDNIIIKEHDLSETTVNHLKGYQFETIIASPYFFKNNSNITFASPHILITTSYLESLEDISLIINNVITKKEPFIIIAKDYSIDFINEIVSMYLDTNIPLVLLKSPSYGTLEYNILNDIAVISNTEVLTNLNSLKLTHVGKLEYATINRETTILSYKNNNNIKEYLQKLENDDLEENLTKRIGMLKNGIIEINVGAPTPTERREKKMRYDDAICAIKSAIEGVLPGSGLIFLILSKELNINNAAEAILKEALTKPMEQILENAALNKEEIINHIINSNYQELYNIDTERYENIKTTSVTDTAKVLTTSLENAVSIASMLLTTTSLVINEFVEKKTSSDFMDL